MTIASDRNGDGLPEPEETMVLGLDGKPIFDAGAPSPSTPPAAVADAGPDLTTPPASTASVPDSPLVLSDAGIPGKPTRGGAKR